MYSPLVTLWYSLVVEHHVCAVRVHYDDVIMTTIASQITSLTSVYSTVYSDADQRKHQNSASLAFVWGIHRDRWIPRTKGQLRGKCFHLMTSSWSTFFSVVPIVTIAPKAMCLTCADYIQQSTVVVSKLTSIISTNTRPVIIEIIVRLSGCGHSVKYQRGIQYLACVLTMLKMMK